MRKNRPLHTSQGSWKKTPLRRLSKSKMKIKTHLPSAGKGKRELGQRWQKVGKGEQRQANRSGGRRSKQTDTPESEGGQLYKKESRLHGLLSFCYYCTLWKTSGNGLLHVELANAAGSIRQHSTLCWPTLHVVLTDSPRFVYWNLMPKSVQKRKIIYHLAIYHLPFDTFCRRTAAVTCWLSTCIRFKLISSKKWPKP